MTSNCEAGLLKYWNEDPLVPLEIQSDFGLGSTALIQCRGRLDASTYPLLESVLIKANDQEYRNLVLDLNYCRTDGATLRALFECAMARRITMLTTTAIWQLSEHWNCSPAAAFERMTGKAASVEPDAAPSAFFGEQIEEAVACN